MTAATKQGGGDGVLFRFEGYHDRSAQIALLKINRLVLRVVAGDCGADVRGDFAAASVAGETGGHHGDRTVVADGFGSVVSGELFAHRFRRVGGVPSCGPCFEYGAVGGIGLIFGIADAQRGAADVFDLGEFFADPRGEREGFPPAKSDGGFGALAGDFFLECGHQAGQKSSGDLIADFLGGGVGGEGARRQDEGDEKGADGRRGDRPYRGEE